MIICTLFKDITGMSYNKIRILIKKWLPLSNTSIHHNVQMIRYALEEWARFTIIPLSHGRLERMAKKIERPKPCENVILFLDSVDFPMSGKRRVHREKKKWSQKLKRPGRKYLSITNARSQVMWVSKGHKPTVDDSDLLLLYSSEITEKFEGCTMVADNHFRKAAKIIKGFQVITNKSNARRPKLIDGKKIPHTLSQEDEMNNSIIAGVRGRVEGPYGWMKLHFKALSHPFYEDKNQHLALVMTAFACHYNMIKK